MKTDQYIYLASYVFEIAYFAALGIIMLSSRSLASLPPAAVEPKRRMMRSAGVLMLVWALDWLIYLPLMLMGYDYGHPFYRLCFLFCPMSFLPIVYVLMRALLQKGRSSLPGACVIAAQFLLLSIWYAMVPSSWLPIHIASALSIGFMGYLLIAYRRSYHRYVRHMHSEYSCTTDRDLHWSWACLAGFTLQAVVYVVYQYSWTFALELAYMVLSGGNAAYICYCTYKQEPLLPPTPFEPPHEAEPHLPAEQPGEEAPAEPKAFYGIVEQKLESLCEQKLLFLEPDLTRDALCRHIAVSSTYLKLYFRSRGLSFYQYINTLRAQYALRLMLTHPHMPIREVSEQSGFRSQTTFRKIFREVMGCLPSEVNRCENTETPHKPITPET